MVREEIPPKCWGTKVLTCSIPAPHGHPREVGGKDAQAEEKKSEEYCEDV